MAEYRVWLTETVTYEVQVEADDREEAEELATEELCGAEQLAAYFDDSTGFEVTNSVRIKSKAKELVAA
ncbi:hypothetical protein ACGFXC_24215 [Streptomyces sp. NPDC048507]|uniref:hypothetical protein n=1 Tax=Streptomyces sp. NPDC048507 TaxID=3365560 RepID=UPI0037242FF9